jgi:hypothetical protein
MSTQALNFMRTILSFSASKKVYFQLLPRYSIQSQNKSLVLLLDQIKHSQYDVDLVNSLIAQPVERRTVNPQVPGSNPGRGATYL